MGNELQLLLKAIRRPMRRWWWRVGSWWLGLTILLIALELLHRYLPFPNPIRPASTVGFQVTIISISAPPVLVLWLACTLWLLAASHSNRWLDKLAGDVPVPRAAFSPLMRWIVALRQGWWPLLLIAVMEVGDAMHFAFHTHWEGHAVEFAALAGVTLGKLAKTGVLMLWITGLLAATHPLHWPVWLWWIVETAVIASVRYRSITFVASARHSIPMATFDASSAASITLDVPLIAAGIALHCLLICLLCRRHIAAWVLYAAGTALSIGRLLNVVLNIHPSVLAKLHLTQVISHELPLVFIADGYQRFLQVYGVTALANVPVWIRFAVHWLNLAWVVVVYFLIRGLLCWGWSLKLAEVSRRDPKNAG